MNGQACDMAVKVVTDLGGVGEILEEVETEQQRLVLDMRALPEEEMQVKLLVEGLACRPQRVAQLWLPNLPKKFKEFVSRLQKRQETKSLVSGVVMAEANLEEEKCFALAGKVAAMYKVVRDIGRFLKDVSRFSRTISPIWWLLTPSLSTTLLGRW